MLGGWASVTVTVKEQVAEFPLASMTLKVFVVTPIGNVAPLAKPAIRVVFEPTQLSAPTGVVYVTIAVQATNVVFEFRLDGQLIVGN